MIEKVKLISKNPLAAATEEINDSQESEDTDPS